MASVGFNYVANRFWESAFFPQQAFDLGCIGQMAINQTQSGIWSDFPVNSTHDLGDRTLFLNRYCRRL
ncbi:MAG: hypothetical protein MJA27_17835 [Pseudanabaenales cyanobacterium]|nr:hypothetical protein [Pseudanabaenales cyanobacterium]